MRPSRRLLGLMSAVVASSRSEDPHTKVGCAVENKDGRIVAVAYNGLPPKTEMPPHFATEEGRAEKRTVFIHAEINALSLVPLGQAHTLYLTISPCKNCCASLAANGVKKVIYLEKYHLDDGFAKNLDFYGILHEEATEQEKELLLPIQEAINLILTKENTK